MNPNIPIDRRGFFRERPRVLKVHFDRILKKLMIDCELDGETQRYITQRFRAEGVTFLTKTLPLLTKAVLKSFELGKFERPTQFAWKGSSLRVFRSLLCEIFDVNGYVRSPDHVAPALRKLRQFCDYFYKLSFSFTKKELSSASKKYEEHEQKLTSQRGTLDEQWVRTLRSNFETYYPSLARANTTTVLSAHRPRFTSGAYYGSELPYRLSRRGRVQTINYGVRKQLPYSRKYPTVLARYSQHAGYFREYPGARAPVHIGPTDYRGGICKVLFVPKDSRGPRVISKEDLQLVRIQMSFFDFVSSELQRITEGRINFTDQRTNQELARRGSITREWVTLDLKDASDSVSYELSKRIFQYSPAMRYFIRETRSTHAELNGKLIKLSKLAGMGSGLTFPTMALIIHLSVCSNVARKTGTPYSEVAKMVYVYGDDVIVPREWAHLAKEGITFSQLAVNNDKSFVHGFFKESCGADYYYGTNVTPIRLRLSSANLGTVRDCSRMKYVALKDNGILQLERHCRELVDAGLLALADYYYQSLKGLLGFLPYVSRTSSCLGIYDNGRFVNELNEYAFVPKTVVGMYDDLVCPHKHLGRKLAPAHTEDRLAFLFPDEGSMPYGVISHPREVKLMVRPVSLEKF